MGKAGIDDPIAADGAVHPDVVVKIVSRDGTGNLVDVIRSWEFLDSENPGTCKAFPIETLLLKKPNEFGTKLAEELNRIGGDKNFIAQNDNRSRQDVFVSIVAIWEPA